MTIDHEYVGVSDLFEDAVKRAVQLASLATVLQDAMACPDGDPAAQRDTAELLSELLRDQRRILVDLQDAHRKDHLSRQNK